MKYFLVLFLWAPASLAQSTCPTGSTCITVPSQQVAVIINGTTIQITIPAQAVPLPAATGALPTGMTYSATTGLTVSGAVTASGTVTGQYLAVTGGSAVPTCTSGLYLLQYAAATNTLTPACYTLSVIPPITVSQAASGGPITLTP